jgi:hypothetical protein
MHRSPKASLAFLFLLMTVGLAGLAQNNPATPNPGSGLPQTPVPNTAPSQPPASTTAPATANQPASPQQTAAPASGQQNTGRPAATGASTGQNSADQKTAEQKAADQRAGDQKKSDTSTTTPTPSATPTPIPQAQPKTDILDSSATSGALVTDGHDPILDPAPVPRTTTTLVGGIITGVDRLRNRLTLHVFGGNRWTVSFD